MIPRHQTAPPASDPARREFGEHLRSHRQEKGLSLEEIASTTRIPARSLRRLEAGRFEDLPADIFVRGFLRSYASCVDLDPEETVRRYAECGLEPAPVCTRETVVMSRQLGMIEDEGEAEASAPVEAGEAEAEPASSAEVAPSERRPRQRTFGLPELFPRSREDGARRGSLTLGVIILVIVATLAMSYLMRRPSDAGDGVTEAERIHRVQPA